jgi:hypothetical protein
MLENSRFCFTGTAALKKFIYGDDNIGTAYLKGLPNATDMDISKDLIFVCKVVDKVFLKNLKELDLHDCENRVHLQFVVHYSSFETDSSFHDIFDGDKSLKLNCTLIDINDVLINGISQITKHHSFNNLNY